MVDFQSSYVFTAIKLHDEKRSILNVWQPSEYASVMCLSHSRSCLDYTRNLKFGIEEEKQI